MQPRSAVRLTALPPAHRLVVQRLDQTAFGAMHADADGWSSKQGRGLAVAMAS